MTRTVFRPWQVGTSNGNTREVVIVALLLISAGAGVWTYWPDLQRLLAPNPIPSTASTTPLPSAPLAVPAVAQKTEEPKHAPARLAIQSSRLAVPVLNKNTQEIAKQAQNTELNLVDENLPIEIENSEALPEKLNPVSVGKKVPSRAEERAKMMAEEAKKDITARTREFLHDSEIAGVRLAGKMSRLLFNGRVYNLGDTVGSEIKVKITKMTPTEITFEDGQGKVYPVHY